jgi:hypothetical protein
MKTTPITVTGFLIEGVAKLDPITVLLQDLGPGKGKLYIECYGQSWNAFWPVMGKESTHKFITIVGAAFIFDCIALPMERTHPMRRDYLFRVIAAVQEALTQAIEANPTPNVP